MEVFGGRLMVENPAIVDPPRGGDLSSDEAAEHATVKDRTILVLEDEFIIAMELEDVLGMEHGAHVHIASTPQAALDILERYPVDVAILDVNIAGESSFPVARVLSERGIPFLFATGYEAASSAMEAFSAVPVLAKPYTMSSVVAALRGMIRA